jgi:chromosome segregation ATPase
LKPLLGRNLHAIILKDAKVVSEIIGHLKKKKLGHAALLIPKLTEPRRNGAKSSATGGARVGYDKVKAPKPLEALVTSLLGDVVIFPELEQALECKKREPALAMATLGGEYVSRQGIVFTGSSEVRAASLLERKAQIAIWRKKKLLWQRNSDSVSAGGTKRKPLLKPLRGFSAN